MYTHILGWDNNLYDFINQYIYSNLCHPTSSISLNIFLRKKEYDT